jgi:hypothetical protein
MHVNLNMYRIELLLKPLMAIKAKQASIVWDCAVDSDSKKISKRQPYNSVSETIEWYLELKTIIESEMEWPAETLPYQVILEPEEKDSDGEEYVMMDTSLSDAGSLHPLLGDSAADKPGSLKRTRWNCPLNSRLWKFPLRIKK